METQYEALKNEKLRDVFIRSYFDISKFENSPPKAKNAAISPKQTNADRFSSMLTQVLNHNLPAKELIALIVKCALQIEYGEAFCTKGGFEKMAAKIANSIMINPPLRRQILAATNQVLEKKTSKPGNLN